MLQALKRLGGTQLSASQRLRLKKKGQLPTANPADKEQLEKLTSLSDWMLHQGRDTIYQDTYEKLNYEIKQATGTYCCEVWLITNLYFCWFCPVILCKTDMSCEIV